MKKIIVEATEYINISTIIWHLKYDKTIPCVTIADTLAKLSEISYYAEFGGLPHLRLRFTSSRCHFGGIRYWFVCPTCGKRIGKLYVTLSANEFKCRRCHNLTYQLCQIHNQRVSSLLKELEEVNRKRGDEALTIMIRQIGRTRRGGRLLQKVCDKWDNPFPLPFMARKHREECAYEKYIKPLFGVLDFPPLM